ncbi:MAG: hypothetical protein Q9170_001134 [Blastenia crenularia]
MESICKTPVVFSWLDDCDRNHGSCKPRDSATPLLPTRVIDVEAGDDHEPTRCRLVISEGRHEKYVTLSHCWGNIQNKLALTHENMPTLLAGFSDTALPQTFRDAIWITRQLKQGYLWIDSLCIIQPVPGDNTDWVIEGSKMSDIYSNSWLTIAASGAVNSQGSWLFGGLDYEISVSSPLTIEQANHAKCDYSDKVLSKNSERFPMAVAPLPSWTDMIESSPLSSRAWALQERLLSRRTLYMTAQGFFWECAERRASVYEPNGCVFDKSFRDHGLRNINQIVSNEQSDRILGYHWQRIIEHYSRLGMTVKSDRLPAIAGLAERLEAHTGDVYFAGHWRSTLLASLLWFRPTGENDETVADIDELHNGIPSWSWAAMPGAVNFSRQVMTDNSQQLSGYYFTPSIKDIDGNSTIHLVGLLKAVKLDQAVSRIITTRKTIQQHWAIQLPMAGGIDQVQPLSVGNPRTKYIDGVASVEIIHDAINAECHEETFLLQILSTSHDKLAADEARHEGLVLKQQELGGDFKRIGFFTSRCWQLFDGIEPRAIRLV